MHCGAAGFSPAVRHLKNDISTILPGLMQRMLQAASSGPDSTNCCVVTSPYDGVASVVISCIRPVLLCRCKMTTAIGSAAWASPSEPVSEPSGSGSNSSSDGLSESSSLSSPVSPSELCSVVPSLDATSDPEPVSPFELARSRSYLHSSLVLLARILVAYSSIELSFVSSC
eukprot:COSAG01_NODE_30934_length_606_cov_13.193294_1_plen_170_part_10